MNLYHLNPRSRFSEHVGDYALYRPSYSNLAIQYLEKEIGLRNRYIADIGAGTGILTKQLLINENRVIAIEPNDDMRKVCEQELKGFQGIQIMKGTAENTFLPDKCLDMIFVAQAFHWFNAEKAIHEFFRILKKQGYIILLWNELKSHKSNFRDDYDKLFSSFSREYRENCIEINEEWLRKIMNGNKLIKKVFDNHKFMNREQFLGRLLSSSFCPCSNEKFLNEGSKLFEKYQTEGKIVMEYDTLLYYAKII